MFKVEDPFADMLTLGNAPPRPSGDAALAVDLFGDFAPHEQSFDSHRRPSNPFDSHRRPSNPFDSHRRPSSPAGAGLPRQPTGDGTPPAAGRGSWAQSRGLQNASGGTLEGLAPPGWGEGDAARQAQLAQTWSALRQPWKARLSGDAAVALTECEAAFRRSGGRVVAFEELLVRDVIGKGAFATVYVAALSGFGDVAFKKLGVAEGDVMQAKTLRDFSMEVQLLRKLKHPNVVAFLGATVEPLGVLTELCSRGNVMAVLHDERVALPWLRKLNILLDTARGMEYLHAQTPPVVHRDLKSLNLLIDHEWSTKVTDFGLSRFKADSSAAHMTGQTGTYHWMAPEVINSEKYDESADVYSFGVILWEVYGRAIPYEGMSPVQIVATVVARRERLQIPPGCPPDFAQLIRSCWAHDPAERPPFAHITGRLAALVERHEESARRRDMR